MGLDTEFKELTEELVQASSRLRKEAGRDKDLKGAVTEVVVSSCKQVKKCARRANRMGRKNEGA